MLLFAVALLCCFCFASVWLGNIPSVWASSASSWYRRRILASWVCCVSSATSSFGIFRFFIPAFRFVFLSGCFFFCFFLGFRSALPLAFLRVSAFVRVPASILQNETLLAKSEDVCRSRERALQSCSHMFAYHPDVEVQTLHTQYTRVLIWQPGDVSA